MFWLIVDPIIRTVTRHCIHESAASVWKGKDVYQKQKDQLEQCAGYLAGLLHQPSDSLLVLFQLDLGQWKGRVFASRCWLRFDWSCCVISQHRLRFLLLRFTVEYEQVGLGGCTGCLRDRRVRAASWWRAAASGGLSLLHLLLEAGLRFRVGLGSRGNWEGGLCIYGIKSFVLIRLRGQNVEFQNKSEKNKRKDWLFCLMKQEILGVICRLLIGWLVKQK